MTCVVDHRTFRLLDPLVGWDPESCEGLVGCEGGDRPDEGLRLAGAGDPGIDPDDLLRWFLPRWLARGCGPCEWYLATPLRPRRLLRRDGCTSGWAPVWDARCGRGRLVDPVAVAAWHHTFAVFDRSLGKVLVWARGGEVLGASFALDGEPVVLALAPWREVLVALEGARRLLRFGVDGSSRGVTPWEAPGEIVAVAFPARSVDECHVCPLVLVTWDGGFRLWLVDRDGHDFEPLSVRDLGAVLRPSGVTALSTKGFCLSEAGEEGGSVDECWSWSGEPLPEGLVTELGSPPYESRGQLLTAAIDSGIPRCEWHRVRLDAAVPPGTSVEVAVATAEQPLPPPLPQGVTPDPGWEPFALGAVHPVDWQVGPAGALDFLVRRPPGRYLRVRVRLAGNGGASPHVRRIRLDFPRRSSLDDLPSVYGQDPVAADFTGRFLSLFDAVVEDLDRVITRYPALLDAEGLPDQALPWLAGLLGLTFDPGWSPGRRRALIRAAPELYRRRGTPEGLRMAVRLVFDVDAVIEELGPARAWGAIGRHARLGSVRVFSRSRSRFRIGTSTLSGAPLRSFGDPDNDPYASGAYRFRALLPPRAGEIDVERLVRLVAAQSPAHTLGQVRLGGEGLVLGPPLVVGVDTALTPLPAPVLGRGWGRSAVRLGRASVLWSGRGEGPALRSGERSVVGVHTVTT